MMLIVMYERQLAVDLGFLAPSPLRSLSGPNRPNGSSFKPAPQTRPPDDALQIVMRGEKEDAVAA
jgi:hypothetical protein